MSSNTLPRQLYDAANSGMLRLSDPGNGGTIDLRSVSGGVVELTIAAVGETRVLPAATLLKPGITVTLVANQITGSGTCIVGGVTLDTEGEAAAFVTSLVNGAMAWTPASQPPDGVGGSDVTPPWINVVDYGATGDGSDQTAALVAAIAACPEGGTIYVPKGLYRVTGGTVLQLKRGQWVVGEGNSDSGHSSCIQRLGDAATIFNFADSGAGGLSNLAIISTGHCIDTSDTNNLTLRDLFLTAGSGYWAVYTIGETFSIRMENLRVVGSGGYPRTSNGIIICGHTTATNLDVVACDVGVRMWGNGGHVHGGRIEVNNIGFEIGRDSDDVLSTAINCGVYDVQFESNTTNIWFRAGASTLSNLKVTGHAASSPGPSGLIDQSTGIYLNLASKCTFIDVDNYCWAPNAPAWGIGGVTECTFIGCDSRNNSPEGCDWGPLVVGTAPGNTIINTNYKTNEDDTLDSSIDTNAIRVQSLQAIDYLNTSAQGKNLRGINIPVTETETTKAVAFQASYRGGSVDPSSITAGTTGGASLTAGTYYYITTAVTSAGECLGFPERSVTLTGGENSVAMTFSDPGGAYVYKRRIYRGTASGVYDGYYETGLNATSFNDTGAAFDMPGADPPIAADHDNSMQEPDANYAVLVTPNWLTTWRVTSKATSGFTVDFGTAAPASATFDYMIVR